ncbi:MAG: hypothetical protein SFV15_06390 [Polyangiaceae bacterium]|nr:hypothetical protein [Polyangiaceae bacterium]
MSSKFKATLLLAWALLRLLFRRATRAHQGLALFRANFDSDGLPPVSRDERSAFTRFSGCIACGLCDRGEAQRVQASGGAYRGVMALVLAASRSMPDFRAAAYSFHFVPEAVLAQKELICPSRIPFRALARFVHDKAAEVGGPLPLPERLVTLRPRSL